MGSIEFDETFLPAERRAIESLERIIGDNPDSLRSRMNVSGGNPIDEWGREIVADYTAYLAAIIEGIQA